MVGDSGLTWASAVPLVGGMCFGAERALGGTPEYVASCSEAFGANDAFALGRYPGVPYFELSDPEHELPHVDVVVSLCPCSGLSHATTTKFGSEGRRAKNRWMVDVMDRVLGSAAPRVLVGENAPNLYTNAGREVREELLRVATSHGYSLSFMKTTSSLHGIPQNRARSFYFAWKSPTAPLLVSVRRTHGTPSASEYLRSRVNAGPDAKEDMSWFPLTSLSGYKYLRSRFGDAWRTLGGRLHEPAGTSIVGMLCFLGAVPDYVDFLDTKEGSSCPDSEASLNAMERLLRKAEEGKGILDCSPVLPSDGGRAFRSLMWKTIGSAVHPDYDRFITFEEVLALMDVPEDFHRRERDAAVVFTQNVPTATAMDAVYQARLFCEGELDDSGRRVSWMRDDRGELAAGDGTDAPEERKGQARRFYAEAHGGYVFGDSRRVAVESNG